VIAKHTCAKLSLLAIVAVGCSASLFACSQQVNVLPSRSSNFSQKGEAQSSGKREEELSTIDLQTEAVVSESCVQAWRQAIAGDCDGAIKKLKELDTKYPKVATIRFMIGQVLEKCGRKKEAVQYYKDAVREFEFSSIHVYKLAEAMRTTGDAKGSIPHYRKLLRAAPGFSAGKMGLAKALLAIDPNSKEARGLLNQVLEVEPANKEAVAVLANAKKDSKLTK